MDPRFPVVGPNATAIAQIDLGAGCPRCLTQPVSVGRRQDVPQLPQGPPYGSLVSGPEDEVTLPCQLAYVSQPAVVRQQQGNGRVTAGHQPGCPQVLQLP